MLGEYNLIMITMIIPFFNPVPSITTFFKSKNALSQNDAIELSKSDWIAAGLEDIPSEKELKNFTFLKNVNNKYWLDISILENYYTKQNAAGKKINKIILYSFLVLVFLAILFGLLMNLYLYFV